LCFSLNFFNMLFPKNLSLFSLSFFGGGGRGAVLGIWRTLGFWAGLVAGGGGWPLRLCPSNVSNWCSNKSNPPTRPHQTATTCFIATILNPMTLVNAFKPKMHKTRNFHKTLNTKRLSYWNVQHNIINKTKERRMSKYWEMLIFYLFQVGFDFTWDRFLLNFLGHFGRNMIKKSNA